MPLPQLFAVLLLTAPAPADAGSRADDINRLRRVINDEGIPERERDISRKLASMSDHDLRHLAQQHAEMGYSGDPLTVVLASILLLILIVLVIVAIVE